METTTLQDCVWIWKIVQKSTCHQNPQAQTRQAEKEVTADKHMFIPLLIHILGAGNGINWADATPRVQSTSSCGSVSCKAHLHIVQSSGAFYTAAALPLTDYHLGLHRRDRRLDLELMLRWRAYTGGCSAFSLRWFLFYLRGNRTNSLGLWPLRCFSAWLLFTE